jgi:hypothetical protein
VKEVKKGGRGIQGKEEGGREKERKRERRKRGRDNMNITSE